LRHFQSHLVATDELQIRGMLLMLAGANCVPHESVDGRVFNLFGDTGRIEVFADEDGRLLMTDQAAVQRLVQTVQEQLGAAIPPGYLSWPAVKAEIVPEGQRSQLHHACRVPGTDNLYFTIPGKLSQSAACSRNLACKVCRELLEEPLA